MKRLFLISLFLLSLSVVSAYPQDTWVQGPGDVWLYSPRVEENLASMPYSVLQAWHVAKRTHDDTLGVRTLGRSYTPLGLRLVKPLNIHKRWDRTAYTSVYGVDRQVIVPWKPRFKVSNLRVDVS
ncbi:MAG TPA: hypothetical protein VJG90_06980 [Candidatus Nanoarchaeia archaeon]|nr:hypothetical protein [Candidatus Nanoarchaeia archaeon]